MQVGLYICAMFLFYTQNIDGDKAVFDETETKHCLQVLRKQTGDMIQFVDGNGGWYEGPISGSSKRSFTVRITSQTRFESRPYKLHLAIAPTKNMDRLEWFLEKATEIGIDAVTPVICENSERRHLRLDRLEKICLAAMKQSLNAWLPTINPAISFSDFLGLPETGSIPLRFIAHCRKNDLPHLKDNYQPATDVIILIGPEGDFSETEVEEALQHGFREVSLGTSRLRTETAGVVATHIVKLLNE